MYISNSISDLLAHVDIAFFNQTFIEPSQVQDYNKSNDERKKRVYLRLQFDGLEFLIPLKRDITNLSENKNNDLKKCCYKVPSTTRLMAGLDFTKAIIVDPTLILPLEKGISHSQHSLIENKIDEINLLFEKFYKDFKKDLKKNRLKYNTKFRFAVLKEFTNKI